MKRLSLASAILLALTLPACQTAPEATLDEARRDQPKDERVVGDDQQTIANEDKEILVFAQRREAEADTLSMDAVEVTSNRLKRSTAKPDASAAAASSGLVSATPAVPADGAGRQPARPTIAYRRTPEAKPASTAVAPPYSEPANREGYADIQDNAVMQVAQAPVSTFSIDVDTGSYSNVRRMIEQGQLPPADAVRAEELINYFDYGYQPPASLDTPFSVSTELAPAPWNAKRVLMQVGIKGYEVSKAKTPPANLVFLIDTSGSMQSPDKIDLLKSAFKQMLPELRAQDRVSIVVYAGSAGLVLAPTPGNDREAISAAFDAMSAGGSTNGAAGIELAYQMAEQNLIPGGINRVILATDGDFNVGTVSIDALKTLVADKRRSGIALTTLGFGQGNYQDETAEQLADVGNGNHAYIDSLQEARKVLVEEMGSTLLTIAKDVKIQVEFNPALVSEYRLIGYENRMLRREDFNNDKIDAGEIGAGHDVTAIYELTLVGSGAESSDRLRYADAQPVAVDKHGELAWLKLRYKHPDADTSILIDKPLLASQIRTQSSDRLAFAAAVAAYADLLRGGTRMSGFTYADVLRLARRGLGDDERGYRHQFVGMVERTEQLSTPEPKQQISMQQ